MARARERQDTGSPEEGHNPCGTAEIQGEVYASETRRHLTGQPAAAHASHEGSCLNAYGDVRRCPKRASSATFRGSKEKEKRTASESHAGMQGDVRDVRREKEE